MAQKILTPYQFIQKFELGNEDLNHRLNHYVLSEMELVHFKIPEQHSNIGGWQSARDLHAHLQDDSSGGLLLEMFQSFSAPISKYISSCSELFNLEPDGTYDWNYTGAWFNVAFYGSYNAPHDHPYSQISAAYYIQTEDPPKEFPFSGRIDFIHENISYPFFPKPGDLILFPGTTLHFVHPYYGKEPRICLSFNATNVKAIQ